MNQINTQPIDHILTGSDKAAARKHRKMVRRVEKGRINPNCKWAKRWLDALAG